MTDDSSAVPEPLDFHAANLPYGIISYALSDLIAAQQDSLNEFRLDSIREDEKYLAEHPEIRAIIVLILRKLFVARPHTKIEKFIAAFLSRPFYDIQTEIDEYIEKRGPHIGARESTVIRPTPYTSTATSKHSSETTMESSISQIEEEPEFNVNECVEQMLQEMLETVEDEGGVKRILDKILKRIVDQHTPSKTTMQSIMDTLMRHLEAKLSCNTLLSPQPDRDTLSMFELGFPITISDSTTSGEVRTLGTEAEPPSTVAPGTQSFLITDTDDAQLKQAAGEVVQSSQPAVEDLNGNLEGVEREVSDYDDVGSLDW